MATVSERRFDSAPQEGMGRRMHCPAHSGVTEAQQDKGACLGHTALILEPTPQGAHVDGEE